MQVRSILVPYDFSDSSRRALEWASSLAETTKARVTLLHVTNADARRAASAVEIAAAVLHDVTATPGPRPTSSPNASEELRTTQEDLERIRRLYVPTTFESRTIVRDGTAWQGIVDEAKTGSHDLIVMGTHGRSGIRRLVMGSVAEHVIREAARPVVVVP